VPSQHLQIQFSANNFEMTQLVVKRYKKDKKNCRQVFVFLLSGETVYIFFSDKQQCFSLKSSEHFILEGALKCEV
jgi:hypothetical protein